MMPRVLVMRFMAFMNIVPLMSFVFVLHLLLRGLRRMVMVVGMFVMMFHKNLV
jgi:hypothetical protein